MNSLAFVGHMVHLLASLLRNKPDNFIIIKEWFALSCMKIIYQFCDWNHFVLSKTPKPYICTNAKLWKKMCGELILLFQNKCCFYTACVNACHGRVLFRVHRRTLQPRFGMPFLPSASWKLQFLKIVNQCATFSSNADFSVYLLTFI